MQGLNLEARSCAHTGTVTSAEIRVVLADAALVATGSNHRRNPGKRYGTPVAKGPSNSNTSTVSLDHNKYLQVDPGHAHWISSPLLEGK